MLVWKSLGKTLAASIMMMLAIGTCCLGFTNTQAHAMHMQDVHSGAAITCAYSSGDTNTPCPSSNDHRIVAANTSSPIKKDLSIKTQNDPVALLTLSTFDTLTTGDVSEEILFTQPNIQKKTKWVTTLPRSHLS